MLRLIHTVPYIGDISNGPSYSVPMLCRTLASIPECRLTMHTLEPLPASCREWNLDIAAWPRHRFPHPALGRSPEMRKALEAACRSADIIHNHSLWMMPNIYPEFARRGTVCKLVVSPRGCLAPWALKRSWHKKLVSRMLGQIANLRHADMLHATCEKEYLEIRRFGLKQPVMILPNGVDLPGLNREKPVTARRRLLFLGRIHPVKGIEYLLEAWRRLEADFPDWDLIIAGPGDADYIARLKKLAATLPRVDFPGKANGEARTALYAQAELYTLPSHTENFGLTVAEALACGTAAISTDGTPWTELPKHHAGWCVPVGADGLTAALKSALSKSPEELATMGRNGREWMRRDFNWPAIGERMFGAYNWLLGRGERSEYVVID